MTDINEPADGGYVAVQYRSAANDVLVYRRNDEAATAAATPDEHWFCVDEQFGHPLTWEQLVLTGEIAYVGQFVNRQVDFEGEPWAGL